MKMIYRFLYNRLALIEADRMAAREQAIDAAWQLHKGRYATVGDRVNFKAELRERLS